MGVIDRPGRLPGRRAVTVLADIGCVDVTWVFPGKIDAVVTRKTVPDNACVVEDSRSPKCTVVAIVTLVTGDNVPGRFAGPRRSVMAGPTTARYGRMIHVVDWTKG